MTLNDDSEDALEQATLTLFRHMGWDTVNCFDEVFGDTPASPRRPNLGRETTGEVDIEMMRSQAHDPDL